MSAFGPKQKWVGAAHRSASGSKADMTFPGIRFRGRYWSRADIAYCSTYVG